MAIVRHVQHVIEKAILLVPHSSAIAAEMIDRIRDVHDMLPELGGGAFVSWILACEFHCDGEQVQTIHRHPTGAVRLLNVTTGRQRRTAVEDADIVESEESALEHVAALTVLAVHPPGEVQQQLLE